MYEIDNKLLEREKAGKPVLVSLIGCGQMGTDIIAQIDQMKGTEIPVLVDLNTDIALKALETAECSREIVITNDIAEAEKAVNEGKMVVTNDWKIATHLPQVEAVIDCTGSPVMGATITLDCINHKKHIVMMNVECDITVGPILRQMAENAGVVYTLAAGDEPAAIMELYRFANALGFTVVSAGKGKNNPLDITATPDTLAEKAKARDMSAYMLCEFVDGSKTAIEMAAVSNATGLVPDVQGMHGAKSTVDTLNKVFCPKKDGGVLDKVGVVDFAIGVHPGVFLTITTENKRLRSSFIQRDMGNGPYYTLFRPFHLCSMEVPLTAAQAVLYKESSGHPLKKLTSECIAIAKKQMKAGETLDGIGGFCYRVSIELADVASKEGYLPAGLAKGAVLNCDVNIGDIITYDMVELNDTVLLQLRKIQNQMNK
jgi:predicted homoserine dehydrogenase-like protein